jgi:hypothetical protein
LKKTIFGQLIIQVVILFTFIPFAFNLLINIRLNKKFSEEFANLFCNCKTRHMPKSPALKVSYVNRHKKKLSSIVEIKRLNSRNSVPLEISLFLEVSSGSNKVLANLVSELEALNARRKTSNLSTLRHTCIKKKDSTFETKSVAFNLDENNRPIKNKQKQSFIQNVSKSFNLDEENHKSAKRTTIKTSSIKRGSFFKRNSLLFTNSCNSISQNMRRRQFSLRSDYSKLSLDNL